MSLFGKKDNDKARTFSENNDSIARRDLKLISQSLRGNSASFATLIGFYEHKVRALGMSFFKNETDTDDFVQEVFIKVFNNLSNFRGESMFSTWLLRLAYNTAINSVQRRKEYLSLSDEIEIFDKDWTPEERELRSLTSQAIRQTIKELPKQYATCLDMYFFYDMSYNDIAEILDIPLNTITSNIFRAKKILRDKLSSGGIIENE